MVHNILYRRRTMCLLLVWFAHDTFSFLFFNSRHIFWQEKKIYIYILNNHIEFFTITIKKTRLMLVRVFNVQVVLHEAETFAIGHRNKRRGRTGQQDINKPQRFQDTGEHPGVLHCSVGRRSQKVCTIRCWACRSVARYNMHRFYAILIT